MKFKTACQGRKAGNSVVKCLSQGHNQTARVGRLSKTDQKIIINLTK